MNISMIHYTLGQILKIEGCLMILPVLTSVIYREKEGMVYLVTGLVIGIMGCLFTRRKPKHTVFYLKEGCITTALGWIVLSIFGCIPFMMTGEIPKFTDALFETVSGFTTTGSSILSNVEALSHTSLMWRSFTHWIGGMGVLVFLLAIVPMSGGSHMNLMKAESPGPSVGKLVPKVKQTAQILYVIYIALTVLQILILLFCRMPAFDAITTTFGTAGTGGFGIKNDSLAGYSAQIQWVVTIFMILFGVNFNFYYLLLFRQIKKAFSIEEVKWYFIIILAAIGIICLNASVPVLEAAFQVGSIITTTGFATTDFNLWPSASKTVLVLLMFIGACAGSTGGGIKVSRIIIYFRSVIREMYSYVHPKSVRKVMLDGRPLDMEIIKSTSIYLAVYMIIFSCSVLLVSFNNLDVTTNFTAVAATINNIGPGLEMVGPSSNFSCFSDFSKWVLTFDMLAGRLELFPLLMLFHPALYKDIRAEKMARKKRFNI